jgi:integrase
MASVVNRPNGHKWIAFKGPNGKRQTLRLGKATPRQAKDFRDRVERLLFAKLARQTVDQDTARWLGELALAFHSKLIACGLVDGHRIDTVGGLLKDFESSLSVGKSTLQNITVVLNNIREHFGKDCRLTTITSADANVFRGWLKVHGGQYGGPLASATVSRRTRRAKQVFKHAVQRGWLPLNPFEGQRRWNEVNRGKDFFVSREIIGSILNEVRNLEFRAIIVLARFGGLRCPSEILPLEWTAVNWDRQTLAVYAPKTDTHRVVPLFPELDEALSPLFEAAADGATKLFPRHQITGSGLDKTLERACKRAGVPFWQKPWNNMRGTRVTELQDEYPIKVAADWLGHSPVTALKHYAQVVKEHHARAVASEAREKVKLRKSALRGPHES